MNRKVVVDIDGVLADFEGAFCMEFGYESRELAKLESRYPRQALKINQFINDGFVYKSLEPLELGLDIIQYLSQHRFEICLVTARPNPFVNVTRQWLNRHDIAYSSISSSREKTGLITNMNPVCAVDDLLSVHNALLGHNIPTIIVAQPWNDVYSNNLQRVSNINEFIQSLTCIMQRK